VSAGAQLFPTVEDIRSGGKLDSSMVITMDASSKADTSIRAATTDGKALRVHVQYTSTGVPTRQVKVGLKVFTDVIAVKVVSRMEFPNAAGDLVALTKALGGSDTTATTYFALGLGPVMSAVNGGGLAGAMAGIGSGATQEFLGCK